MLKDEILERIFSNKDMQQMSLTIQATSVNAIEQLLDELRKENPYATISDLFADE